MLAKRRSRLHSILFLSATLALGACISNPAEPNVAGGVLAVSGNGQFADLGAAAANPLVVLVIDQNGNPFSGATVGWKVTGGGGTLSDTTSTSDASGHASINYTGGTTAGTATVMATADQLWTTTFTIHVVAP